MLCIMQFEPQEDDCEETFFIMLYVLFFVVYVFVRLIGWPNID